MLVDSFERNHDYLRISLTDVCNSRCHYCIPHEEVTFMPSSRLMSADEIETIAETFVKLGVKKIRLTGGEPLLRKDFETILLKLAKFPVSLAITTNGDKINKFITLFKETGLNSLNISLDTLNREKFKSITKRDKFDQVINNINLLLENDFHVKINMVVMKGINESELLKFVEWTKHKPLHVRFIEFMPFDKNQWNKESVFTYEEMLDVISKEYSYIKMQDKFNDTAKKYKPLNHEGTFAVISTMSQPFCDSCNRMRLTADGKMKNCLFSKGEADILGALRKGEDITTLIKMNVLSKAKKLGGQFDVDFKKIDTQSIDNRSMIKIGG